MCDRKYIDFEKAFWNSVPWKIGGIDRSAAARNALREPLIKLTAEMVLKDIEFGCRVEDRPTSHELGMALVEANRLSRRNHLKLVVNRDKDENFIVSNTDDFEPPE